MKKKKYDYSPYIEKTHFWGRVFSVLALLVLIAVPVLITDHLNVSLSVKQVLKGFLSVAIIFWPTAIIEIFFYSPMLGAGATYLSFVTGNIANLKLPCVINAREITKTKPGSDEDEVVSTIAVATSAIVTTIILAVGVIALAPILPKITAKGSVFAPAFNQVLPALFGALGAGYFAKYWRISIVPILTAVIILVFSPSVGTGLLIPVCVVISIVSAYLMYISGFLTGGVKPENPLKK